MHLNQSTDRPRDALNKKNLVNTYPKGSLTGFQAEGQTQPEGVTHFRTADGSWNNLSNPKEGAAGTRFLRNVQPEAIMPETGQRLMTPNPREISRKLLTRKGEMPTVPFLNMLATTWIQLENHDWTNHGEILLNDVHQIPLAPNDPGRKKYQQEYMFVGKTLPDSTRVAQGETVPVTFINEVTHWWDGSQIYGSDQETQNPLRSFVNAKMIVTEKTPLPVDGNRIEKTGFQRNWWIGLTIMHTLFVREHNAICDQLKISYPQCERGVPRYNEFRRQLGLNPIHSFADLTDDKDQLARLREVYGSDPDKVVDLDLMIGTLSESTPNRPTNFGFGETMFQIFILNATRRLQAERFFTDSYNEETYTREGLDWIDASSFKNVLLRNFPELAATGLANVRNAFERWDNDERLDPSRHLLRAYNEELQPDPWLGDTFG
jgi:hypothetical protein